MAVPRPNVVGPVDGYNDDPRELVDIPAVRSILRQLEGSWPHDSIFIKRHETSRSVDGTSVSRGSSIGFGFGVEFPELSEKGPHAPQAMIFRLGLLQLLVDSATPAGHGTKFAWMMFVVVFSLIASVSSHPVALALGS
jgi:hypothetical protein